VAGAKCHGGKEGNQTQAACSGNAHMGTQCMPCQGTLPRGPGLKIQTRPHAYILRLLTTHTDHTVTRVTMQADSTVVFALVPAVFCCSCDCGCCCCCCCMSITPAVTCEVLYALPGHKGSVNEVVFHPKEPIVGSCSNDRTIFLGELADS